MNIKIKLDLYSSDFEMNVVSSVQLDVNGFTRY
jgi:hypothetical protein